MIRMQLTALASVAMLAFTPAATNAQPGTPRPSGPIRVPLDLVAMLDRSTRVVLEKQVMRVDPEGTTESRAVVPMQQCAGLAASQRRRVIVPPLRWGVANTTTLQALRGGLGVDAGSFNVQLKYTSIVNGLVEERVVTERVTGLAFGAERFFLFTDPGRPTEFEVQLFTEPARKRESADSSGPSVRVIGNGSATINRTFCVATVQSVDNPFVVTVDAGREITEEDKTRLANNVLRMP